MTAFLLSFTLWLGVLHETLSSQGSSLCTILVRKGGLLQATSSSGQLWSVDTGGPLVWAEQIIETEPVQLFPQVTGDLLIRTHTDGGLSKFPKSIQDLAKLRKYEYDETHFFHGTVRKMRFLVDSKSGTVIPLSQIEKTDCGKVLFTRTDYVLELIQKGSLGTISRAGVSEIGTENCLFLESVNNQPIVEEEFEGLGDVVSIGYMASPLSPEDSDWSLFDLVKIAVSVSLSLFIGFKLGSGVHCKMYDSPYDSFISNNNSDKFTVSTSASSPMPLYHVGKKSEVLHDQRKRDLRVMKPVDVPEPLDPKSPTFLQSGTSVKDLIENGRYNETFESAHLMKVFDGFEVYRAKHRLDGKSYVVKVGKFRYDECLTISKVAMFREVSLKLKLKHKNIVNYVTCWIENQDIQVYTHSEDVRTLDDQGNEEQNSSFESNAPADSSPIYVYLYIQCELVVKGANLKKTIKQREVISQKENCWIFKQILKGVAHVHSKNIVHRGMKPSCIYVTSEDVVKIAYFRFAAQTLCQPIQQSNYKPLYSAPEYAVGSTVTKAMDLYPLGFILLELCLPPMDKDTRRQVFDNVRVHRTLPEAMNSLPFESEIILWLTTTDTRDRPSADDVLRSGLMKNWAKDVGLPLHQLGLSPVVGPQ